MNPTLDITGTVQREAWRQKKMPPVEQVSDGLWSVPVVFPGNPMRYTLSYVLVEGDECLVVDPGFDSPEGYRQLQAGLAQADIGLGEVSGILATHFHTDHVGLARRLAEDSAHGSRWGGARQATSLSLTTLRQRLRQTGNAYAAGACRRTGSLKRH